MFVLFSCLLEVHYAWYCLAFNTPASLCGVCFQPNTASTPRKGWRGRMVRPSLMLSILYPPDLLLFTNHYWNFVSFPHSCLMTSAVFNIPFLRQVYSWVKGFPVDKRTFLGKLHRGESFAFTPVSSYVVFAPASFHIFICLPTNIAW